MSAEAVETTATATVAQPTLRPLLTLTGNADAPTCDGETCSL
ncbi:hypothetical protein WDJ51_00385 [Rathayibacter sp. YIM 133350]